MTLALLGIWVANRRAVAMENTAQAQADAVLETEKGRRQERFRDAVNHLGSKSESVRLGGAHALFHLALEDDDLRQSITEVLCAHIRGTTGDEKYGEKHAETYRERYKEKPSTEIQSLMTLLFEGRDLDKRKTLKRFWKGMSADLSGGYFHGLGLSRAQFQGAVLMEAQFQNANIPAAQFQGANLWHAQFRVANLEKAQFQGGNLWRAQFHRAYLDKSRFQGANLCYAEFQGTHLLESQFQGANLLEAGFQGADVRYAQFQGADIHRAQFQETNFYETKFQGVSSGLEPPAAFRKQVKDRANEESDLSGVIFEGGLELRDVNNLLARLHDIMKESELASFRAGLETHVGIPPQNTPSGGVKAGKYDEKDAERWIAEYEKDVGLDEKD